jgi:hypothetical protein
VFLRLLLVTHGQLSAAQGSLTSCLNFDFAILNLFEPSAPLSDGPEVEHGAHFLILYYPHELRRLLTGGAFLSSQATSAFFTVEQGSPPATKCVLALTRGKPATSKADPRLGLEVSAGWVRPFSRSL